MASYQYQIISMNNANDSSAANNTLTYILPFPLKLQDYDIALSSLFLYYSWFNITAAYGNNLLQYIWVDGNTYSVNIPEGFYAGASDINGLMQTIMNSRGHYLVDQNGNPVYYLSLATNVTYYRYTLTATPFPTSLPANWSNPNPTSNPYTGKTPQFIVVPDGTSQYPISLTIGFAPGTYPPTPLTVEYQNNGNASPQISPVTAVNVHLSAVNSSYLSSDVDTVYTFSPNVTFGSLISVEPRQLIWLKAVETLINQLTIRLTDQNNIDLNMVDQTIVANLYLRRRE